LDKSAKIYVAGSNTLIGAAIVRQLQRQGYTNLIGINQEPDLTSSRQVSAFFAQHQPEYVFLAAGKSGGISANQKHPATLMLDNLLIEAHLIQNACQYGVKKLLNLAAACVYPKLAPQPMHPHSLLTGPFEATNDAYATAKLAGMKLCEAYRQEYGANFINAIPANVFGPGDHFDPENSHVIGALIQKMHTAKQRGATSVEIWGTGTPRREFIFADDLADACLFVMSEYNDIAPINLGGGTDLSIKELALHIQTLVGYGGQLYFDTSKPDGMPLKALDSTVLLQMGWRPRTPFREALAITYQWFLQTQT
jgi:GDP-L-fucose synthase